MKNSLWAIILFFVAFWFEGNTLWWIKEDCLRKFSQLQINHNNPPDINEKPISSIKIHKDKVFIISDGKCWILHYEGNESDWYIEDPFNI